MKNPNVIPIKIGQRHVADIILVTNKYAENDRLAVIGYCWEPGKDDHGGPWADISKNMPESYTLKEGEFYLAEYSEYEAAAKALKAMNLIEPVEGVPAQSQWVELMPYRFTEEGKKYLYTDEQAREMFK